MINVLSFNKVEWSSVNFIINCNEIKKRKKKSKRKVALLCVIQTWMYTKIFDYFVMIVDGYIFGKMIIYCFDEKIGRGEYFIVYLHLNIRIWDSFLSHDI